MKNLKNFSVGVGAMLLSAAAVQAVPTTYNGAGNSGPNPATYSFVATGSGEVTAYFVGATASYGSVVGMSVNGGAVGPVGLPNHTSSYGDSFDLGAVAAGDIITFILEVNTSGATPPPSTYSLSSNPAANPDGANHVYSSAYAGDSAIPAGTYVGFEDILVQAQPDYDYDDHQFVFTGPFEAHATPDGGSTAALIGLASLGMVAFRRKQK